MREKPRKSETSASYDESTIQQTKFFELKNSVSRVDTIKWLDFAKTILISSLKANHYPHKIKWQNIIHILQSMTMILYSTNPCPPIGISMEMSDTYLEFIYLYILHIEIATHARAHPVTAVYLLVNRKHTGANTLF